MSGEGERIEVARLRVQHRERPQPHETFVHAARETAERRER